MGFMDSQPSFEFDIWFRNSTKDVACRKNKIRLQCIWYLQLQTACSRSAFTRMQRHRRWEKCSISDSCPWSFDERRAYVHHCVGENPGNWTYGTGVVSFLPFFVKVSNPVRRVRIRCACRRPVFRSGRSGTATMRRKNGVRHKNVHV